MATQDKPAERNALSDQFLNRIQKLTQKEKVRAVVRIRTPRFGTGRRQSKAERDEVISAKQKYVEETLGTIDMLLADHGGKRLSDPNALACFGVETTADGVMSLAECELVDAVLEDQKTSIV